MRSVHNQKGFSVVEGLLVLVALSIVGFTGYFVYNAQKNTDKTLTQTNQASTGAIPKAKAGDTQKEMELCAQAEGLCVTYPSGWTAAAKVTSQPDVGWDADDVVLTRTGSDRRLHLKSGMDGIG